MTTTQTTEIRIDKTYRGKGRSRRTVWAVRLCRLIGSEWVHETLSVWATESEALNAAKVVQ